ncbi:hypothetical protein N9414_16846 [Nodularia spumigena CCY9414]|nr:hypothetical protein N9414_16846 [Nodularia spumigena CCY9414]
MLLANQYELVDKYLALRYTIMLGSWLLALFGWLLKWQHKSTRS